MKNSMVNALLMSLMALPLVANAEDDAPDIELLEFLGAWQTADGEFLDPMLLAGEPDEIPPTEDHDED